MDTALTIEDLKIILESLKYTRLTFENYQTYPSYDYKLKRIEEVNAVIEKINQIKKDL